MRVDGVSSGSMTRSRLAAISNAQLGSFINGLDAHCTAAINDLITPHYTTADGGTAGEIRAVAQVSNMGVQLTWTAARSSAGDPFQYVVFYRPVATDEARKILKDTLSDSAKTLATLLPPVTAGSHDMNPEDTLYNLMYPWQPAERSTSGTSYTFPLSAFRSDTTYEFSVRAFCRNRHFDSIPIVVKIEYTEISLDGLITSTSARQLNISWNTSSDPTITGYELWVLTSKRGNAFQPTNFTSLQLIYNARFKNNAPLIHRQLSCLNINLNSAHPCIFPNTKYVVVIRSFSFSGLKGPKQAKIVHTLQDVPEDLPSISVPLAPTSTTVQVHIQPPMLPNSPLLSCTLKSFCQRTSTMRVYSEIFPQQNSTSFIDDVSGAVAALTRSFTVENSGQDNSMLSKIPIVMDKLEPFSLYNISAYCDTSTARVYSSWQTVTTAEAVPQRLSTPLVQRSGSQSIVSWSAPFPLPGKILYYKLVDGRGSVVYIGNDTSVFIPGDFFSSLCVQAATSQGFGPCSDFAMVTAESASLSSGSNAAPIAASIVAAFVIALVVVLIFRRFKTAKSNVLCPDMREAMQRLPVTRRIIPRALNRDHLELLNMLGEGKFGCVYKALLDESEVNKMPGFIVAVKISKSEVTDKQRKEMMLEAVFMAQFSHPNVASLIGFSLDPESGQFLEVTQYCEHGSLIDFVVSRDEDDVHSFSIHFAADVASGMAYLAEGGFIHRDLAVFFTLLI